MVKGVSRSGASSSQQGTTPPQPLPTMQTGQNPHDPLTQLNSHLGYGAMAGVDPFTEMGLNPNDPNMVRCEPPPAAQHVLLTRLPVLPHPPRTAPNDDELARVPAADVRRHVKPSHPRPDHRAEPTTSSYGSPSQRSLPERQIPRADVRYPPLLPLRSTGHSDSDFNIYIGRTLNLYA